eukprot:2099294-Rhodomonas_salina.1
MKSNTPTKSGFWYKAPYNRSQYSTRRTVQPSSVQQVSYSTRDLSTVRCPVQETIVLSGSHCTPVLSTAGVLVPRAVQLSTIDLSTAQDRALAQVNCA